MWRIPYTGVDARAEYVIAVSPLGQPVAGQDTLHTEHWCCALRCSQTAALRRRSHVLDNQLQGPASALSAQLCGELL